MKIIKQNAVLMDQTTPEEAYQHIERIGRTCYKSEDKITKDSAAVFCLRMKASNHYAMLEHYMIHLSINSELMMRFMHEVRGVRLQNYFVYDYNHVDPNKGWLSGSFRAFLDFYHASTVSTMVSDTIFAALVTHFPIFFGDIKPTIINDAWLVNTWVLSDAKFIETINAVDIPKDFCNEILMKHITHTLLFTTDRGVTHEMVRHRPASFAQESTRYCNYTKGKFGNEITVIEPGFYERDSELYNLWKEGCEHNEKVYFKLIEMGAKPQEARDNLPTSVKADLVVTASEMEWQHIIDLRYHGTTGAPHPQMKELMSIAYPLLVAASDNRLK